LDVTFLQRRYRRNRHSNAQQQLPKFNMRPRGEKRTFLQLMSASKWFKYDALYRDSD